MEKLLGVEKSSSVSEGAPSPYSTKEIAFLQIEIDGKKKGEYFIWIDNVKGIAIVLVVLHHCGYLAGKENLQWFQHAVPLFLFCSAYLLRKKVTHHMNVR